MPAGNDFDGWVALLASRSQRQRAKRHLHHVGAPVVPALRRGLDHPDPMVRRTCVNLLDQLVDDSALGDLVRALDDDDVEVRRRALHALACDACKSNGCLPSDDLFIPRAIELLRDDPNPDVRASAVDALGRAGARGHRPALVEALEACAARDPRPELRSMARQRLTRLRRSRQVGGAPATLTGKAEKSATASATA